MAITKVDGNWLVTYAGADQTLNTKDKYLDANIKVTGQAGAHAGAVASHSITTTPVASVKIAAAATDVTNITTNTTSGDFYFTVTRDGQDTTGKSSTTAKAVITTAGYIATDSAASTADVVDITSGVKDKKFYVPKATFSGNTVVSVIAPSVTVAHTETVQVATSGSYYVDITTSKVDGTASASGSASSSAEGYIKTGSVYSGSDSKTITPTVTGAAKVYIKSTTVAATGGGLTKGTASGGGLSGGGLTAGAGSVSGSGVTLADSDPGSGITVSGSGTVNRAAVTRAAFSQSVSRAAVKANVAEGYTAANTGELIAAGSETVSLAEDSSTIGATSKASNTATKYISKVTLGSNKTLGSSSTPGIDSQGTLYIQGSGVAAGKDVGELYYKTDESGATYTHLVTAGRLITTSVTPNTSTKKFTWGTGWITEGSVNASEACSDNIEIKAVSGTTVAGYATASVQTGSINAPTAPLASLSAAATGATTVTSKYFKVTPTAGSVTKAGWITSQSNGTVVNYTIRDFAGDGVEDVEDTVTLTGVTPTKSTDNTKITWAKTNTAKNIVVDITADGWAALEDSRLNSATSTSSATITLNLYAGETL